MLARIFCVVVLSWSVLADQDEVEGGKCERITLSQCQDLKYNWTAMPNLLGHNDQKEAEEAMSAFSGLLASECSPHARFLLCSAFAPLCSAQVAGSVSACRALCERVVADCRAQLRLLPAPLDCAAFPQRPGRRLCMRPPDAGDPEPEPAPPPRWPFEPRACPPGHARAPGGACRPACGQPVRYSLADRRAAELGTTALAWLATLSTTLALLTFCAEPARYRYPERPAAWLAACNLAAALAHVARGWLGAEAVSCAGGALAADGLAAPACAAYFAVTYYCTLAADAWLAGAGVAWYLTAAGEWSTEALERAAAYLHAAAWGWAGAWTAAALALRRVAADELTGTCGVADAAAAALEGVPRGALLLAAAALAAGAAPGIARVRRALDPRGSRRVGRLALRAAAGGLLYLVLAALAVGFRVWEARAREARGGVALLAALEAGEAGAGGEGAGAAASTCLRLAGGVAAGSWAWSRKSAAVWRRVLCPPRKAPCCAPPLLAPPPYYKRPLHVSRV
ncbi:frizzled-9-like [Aricia agestis]|uniref:frizzled-9-like n=1 Tax=Aricia agestis TaxID=91739 RepID=UPI001C2092F9|nr:frizzled-9-like [Aricia agestis]